MRILRQKIFFNKAIAEKEMGRILNDSEYNLVKKNRDLIAKKVRSMRDEKFNNDDIKGIVGTAKSAMKTKKNEEGLNKFYKNLKLW